MRRRDRPVIGILGGMGPEATVELMRRVIAATPAHNDSDHIHMIVDNNPTIPSRIAHLIERTGEDPAPSLARMAMGLEAAGASIIAMPCNTAHAYAAAIRAAVSIPMLDMIALTAERMIAMPLVQKRVGLLASTAVHLTGLYENALAPAGIEFVAPLRQEDLMAMIRAVKRGETGAKSRRVIASIAGELVADRIDLLLVACTELSILAEGQDLGAPVLDSLDVLARAIVTFGIGATQDT